LVGSFDGARAVVGPYPGDGLRRRATDQHRKASEGSTSSPVAAQAADLDPFTCAGPAEQRLQSAEQGPRVRGHAPVWPVQQVVRPGRLPLGVEVEAVVRGQLTGIGVPAVEGRGSERGGVWQSRASCIWSGGGNGAPSCARGTSCTSWSRCSPLVRGPARRSSRSGGGRAARSLTTAPGSGPSQFLRQPGAQWPSQPCLDPLGTGTY
jgi:hypothetical protein